MNYKIPEFLDEKLVGFVSSADGDFVQVKLNDGKLETLLSEKNFEFVETSFNRSIGKNLNLYRLPVKNDNEKAKIFDFLRKIGIPFASEIHGWPPSAVFELLRENGLLAGDFKETYIGADGNIKIQINS